MSGPGPSAGRVPSAEWTMAGSLPLTAHCSPLTVLIAGGGTGGHLMPALAIAQALREAHADWRVVLVGAERGVEATLLPQRDFPFHLLPLEPIYRRQWWKNLRWPILAVRLLGRIKGLLDREHPALVLGTGGYAAGPVVWTAARRGIPTAILEQDARPGLVTRWLAPRVRHVYLGAPEARDGLAAGSGTEVFITGSPITPPAPERRERARRRFALPAGQQVVLVTGGSQGALGLNQLVEQWVDAGGAADLTLLWATGRGTYHRFRRLHRPPLVQVFDFLDPIADAYAVSDLAVCRAGMMTIAELCAWGIPSILVPLPSSAADHQSHNARALQLAGAAIAVAQSELSGARLGSLVRDLLGDPLRLGEMGRRATARAHPQAVTEICGHLEALLR